MNLPVPDPSLTSRGFLLQGVLARDSGRHNQLWILGHAGRDLWENFSQAGIQDEVDPLDTWSLSIAVRYLGEHGVSDYEVLYPRAENQPDLVGLGRELGWHHDSPLGTGIHPVYGSWFAYRVVIAVRDVFDAPVIPTAQSPCEQCSGKPCLSACPAGATGGVFNLEACAGERMASDDCALQCLARNACPVGREHAYGTAQMRYHYGLSLRTIRLLNSGGAGEES